MSFVTIKVEGVRKLNQRYMSNRWGRTAQTARRFLSMVLLGALTLLLAAPLSASATPNPILPPLGTAASFGVLAGSAVTNTGPTRVMGDLGVSPGSAVSGFPPGIVSGTIHAGDSVALQAQNDAIIAYNSAAGQTCDLNLTGQDLGGMTLAPGVYCFASSAQLTGQLTLDGQGNPNSIFIIQIVSTLTTASNAQVLTINGAQPCRIFWQVGSSATLGTSTSFKGNLLALTSITVTTGATTSNGVYARNGAVTLDTNDIQACGLVPAATNTPTSTAMATNTRVPRATNTRAPVATNTQVPGATNTPIPVATNTPINIPTQTPANTQVPEATNTPIPVATNTPINIPTQTPANTPTKVVVTPGPPLGLPPTGGDLSWVGPFALLIGALVLAAGLGVLRLSRRRLRNSVPPM